MPLLHREKSRGGGGSQENRRSLAEILSFDASQFAGEAATPKANLPNGEGASCRRGEGASCRRRAAAGSPAPAHSPRALVPPACFPPGDHPAAAHTYAPPPNDPLAQAGGWANEPYEGISDLVESFKALATPAPGARRSHSIQTRLSCELTLESSWPPEGAFSQPQDPRALSRRASFCGAVERARMPVWSGVLPARGADASPPGGFSPKVFLGGLPWDIGEDALLYALRDFQPVRVEWPGHDASPRGFAYVTLESERRVRALLHASRRDAGKWIYRITARSLRTKDVEVIPWAVADSNWVSGAGAAGSLRLEPARTVFVGALHGVLSASALATIMNDLFSGVVYAGIDTDKNKYPIGSGRVTFGDVRAYVRAISAQYVEIRTDKFTKKIQVDPYLEDSMCSICNLQQGPYFCREPACFSYFCRSCWAWKHSAENHKALMRNSKSVSFGACNGNSTGGASGSGSGGQRPAGVQHAGLANGGFAQSLATPSPSTSGGSAEGGEQLALEWSLP